jgi:transcriptional regulator with XRE-family HTH domain
LTQAKLGKLVGVVQSTVSDLELGKGGSLSVDVWQRTFAALDRTLRFYLSRDPREEPADAGHLGLQELVLRLARETGRRGSYELQTRPTEPWRSTDLGIRDDRHRALVLVECWNTIGDIGVAARATTRKVAEAEQLAVVVGGEKAYRVASCWVVRATRRNRELIARYPEVFAARFPGSSVAWARSLTIGDRPPMQPGVVWADTNGTRVVSWRKRPTP